MKANPAQYEQLALEELRAAQRALSVPDRIYHEQQAHRFALMAHELERQLTPA